MYVVFNHRDDVVRGSIRAVNQTVVTDFAADVPQFTFDRAYQLVLDDMGTQNGESGSAVFVVTSGQVKLLAMFCSSNEYEVDTMERRCYALSMYDGLLYLREDDVPGVYIPGALHDDILRLAP